jgi:cysteine synthase A
VIHEDAASLIGHTPLVELKRLAKGQRGSLFAKVESLNPGFSKKDRIARQIVDDALQDGRLKPGDTVVELTSGNTGTGLAIVCAVRGLRFVAVMSAGNSPERRRMMEALGARVEIVPQAAGSPPGQVSGLDLDLVERRTVELARQLGAFRADQFRNPSNVLAHEEGTAAEIWGELGARVTHFCDFVGSAGTFVGVARGLKKRKPSIQCHAIEPSGAALLGTGTVRNASHRIQGGGYSIRPPFWEESLVDGYLTVTDQEAARWARELARVEGLFAGFSSGANVAGALTLLERSERDAQPAAIVFTINDSGLKYLSTDLWA